MCPWSKGFVTGGGNGMLYFWMAEDDNGFSRKQEIKLENAAGVANNAVSLSSAVTVRAVAMSNNEESFCFTTSNSQIYKVSLANVDLTADNLNLVPEPLLTPFHVGPINGLDVCIRKPLVVTVGADKTVRVWNYLEKTCELCKVFNEEAHSVALHPSGFHLIVGFSDKLRGMNLLMEELRPFKDIPIKGCRECRFSNGGQYFAATNSNVVQVYKTYTCEMVLNLRGHNNKVRSISWTPDDSALVTTGTYTVKTAPQKCYEGDSRGCGLRRYSLRP